MHKTHPPPSHHRGGVPSNRSNRSFSAISVDDNTKEFDFMYGTNYCEQVKNEQNIDFVCEMLRNMNLRASYELRNIAAGLRWLVSNWTIKNAALVVSRITTDWSVVDVAKLTSLLSEDWPLDPHTVLFSKSLLSNKSSAVMAEYCAVLTQKWSVPATLRMAKELAAISGTDPEIFARQIGFELLSKLHSPSSSNVSKSHRKGVLARVTALVNKPYTTATGERIRNKTGDKYKTPTTDSEDEGDDDETRDTCGPLPTINGTRKGRLGIPVAEMGAASRKQHNRRRHSQSFAVEVSDLGVKVAGGRRMLRPRYRSETL